MQFEEFIAAVGTAANAMGVGSRPVALRLHDDLLLEPGIVAGGEGGKEFAFARVADERGARRTD